MAKKTGPVPKLEGKIDQIVELILEGLSFRKIAERLNIALTTLHDFTSKAEHSARVREALEYSAQTFDDKAEEVLLMAKSNLIEIQRARELAQHYRWKASKRNPRKYGDKIDLTSNGKKIEPTTITWGGKDIKV